MIEVKPMGQNFSLVIGEADDAVTLHFKQLNYFARNMVATKATRYQEGKLILDIGLQCFYVIKYGLKGLEGFKDAKGEDYKLNFVEEGAALTDKCVDEILACNIADKLILASREIGLDIPEFITDPVTGEPIKGISVIPANKLKGVLEKK